MIKSILSIMLAFCTMFSCKNDQGKQGLQNGESELEEAVAEVLTKTKATKIINTFDELGCEVYRTGPLASEEPTQASITYELGNTQQEGVGSFQLNYHFSGLPMTSKSEYVYFEQTWGDWRFDLSFYPLGLSIWVKGNPANKGVFRFIILEDEKQFSADAPHDNSRKRWSYYAFEDKEILSKTAGTAW